MSSTRYMEGYRGHWLCQIDAEETWRIWDGQNNEITAGLSTRMDAVIFINKRTGSNSSTWDFSKQKQRDDNLMACGDCLGEGGITAENFGHVFSFECPTCKGTGDVPFVDADDQEAL